MKSIVRIALLNLFIQCLFLQSSAFALTDEEVACNRSLNDNHAKQALLQADKLLKDNPENEHAWTCKGRAYYLMDNAEDALEAFKSAENFASDNYEKSFAAVLSGHIYKHTNETQKAIESYQKSLDYAKKGKNLQALVLSNYVNIGDIYFSEKQYTLALDNFKEANKIAANDNERGDTLGKISKTYFALEEYELAVEHQLQTQTFQEKAGTLTQYAEASIDLGYYYMTYKRLKDAERTLDKIIKFANENGGAYFEAKASFVMAQVQAAKGNKTGAKDVYDYAMKLSKGIKDVQLEALEKQTRSVFK